MKVVIVGGVAGGASAAARLRRLDENAEIVIIEKSGHISYANCGLPYYVGGVIEEEQSLYLQTPERFWQRFRVNAKVNHEAIMIDRENKVLLVKNLKTGEVYGEGYDKLILSPGARPIVPQAEGFDRDGVFSLRNSEDAVHLRAWIESKKPQSAVVIGGGFIGIEIAENLRERGLSVSLIEKSDHILPPFDSDMASFVHREVKNQGVNLYLKKGAVGYDGSFVFLEDGEKVKADVVVLAIGVLPDSSLAKDAGLAIGLKGSIVVDKNMMTSDENIYAVGDAIEVYEIASSRKGVIPLAGPANKQGRIAADNIAGIKSEYKGSLGTSILKVFSLSAASTGMNERTAKSLGIDYDYVVLSPLSHAQYYPGGQAMTLKVLFEKGSGKLLGAQIVGHDGVDKRIDVIATAMRAGLKVEDLAELELSYAPPFSSAKDPVNMAGFASSNVLKGLVKQFSYEDIGELRKRDVVLLDTRTVLEYSKGHAEGFVNIPLDELRERLGEIDKSKSVYVMCQSGLRSYLASRILTQHGYDAYNFRGGYKFYSLLFEELGR